MFKEDAFSGKTALVTGAAAGIGLSVAENFAQAGANAVLVDIDSKAGAVQAQRLEAEGRFAFFVEADVTDDGQVAAAIESAIARFGGLDILVNNAGGFFETRPFIEVSLDEWNKMLALNLTSAFLFSKSAVPHMVAQKFGRIVNISSLAGQSAQQPAPVYYSAAKAALLGFTRNIALELGPHNITVNAVAPATTRSPRVDRVRGEEVYRRLEATTPLRRVGEPQDIASAVLYLASEAASFITGSVISVNGGRFMA